MTFTSSVPEVVAQPVNRLAEYLVSFSKRQKCKADILSWLDGWTTTKRANNGDGWAWIVVDELAKELGWHPETLRKHFKELVAQELIERRPAKRWHCDQAWAYRINEIKLQQFLSKEVVQDDALNPAEVKIRNRLQSQLGGMIEVETTFGLIDLLTDTEVIEVKRIKGWKSGLGQVLVYSSFYPSHKKRLHLFGNAKNGTQIVSISAICLTYNVLVTFEVAEGLR